MHTHLVPGTIAQVFLYLPCLAAKWVNYTQLSVNTRNEVCFLQPNVLPAYTSRSFCSSSGIAFFLFGSLASSGGRLDLIFSKSDFIQHFFPSCLFSSYKQYCLPFHIFLCSLRLLVPLEMQPVLLVGVVASMQQPGS